MSWSGTTSWSGRAARHERAAGERRRRRCARRPSAAPRGWPGGRRRGAGDGAPRRGGRGTPPAGRRPRRSRAERRARPQGVSTSTCSTGAAELVEARAADDRHVGVRGQQCGHSAILPCSRAGHHLLRSQRLEPRGRPPPGPPASPADHLARRGPATGRTAARCAPPRPWTAASASATATASRPASGSSDARSRRRRTRGHQPHDDRRADSEGERGRVAQPARSRPRVGRRHAVLVGLARGRQPVEPREARREPDGHEQHRRRPPRSATAAAKRRRTTWTRHRDGGHGQAAVGEEQTEAEQQPSRHRRRRRASDARRRRPRRAHRRTARPPTCQPRPPPGGGPSAGAARRAAGLARDGARRDQRRAHRQPPPEDDQRREPARAAEPDAVERPRDEGRPRRMALHVDRPRSGAPRRRSRRNGPASPIVGGERLVLEACGERATSRGPSRRWRPAQRPRRDAETPLTTGTARQRSPGRDDGAPATRPPAERRGDQQRPSCVPVPRARRTGRRRRPDPDPRWTR